MGDFYYSPEKYGMTQVAHLDDPSADYSFDVFVVWQAKGVTGVLVGRDSGCSCPTPFEDFDIDDLDHVTDHGRFCDLLDAYEHDMDQYNYIQSFHADVNQLRAKALSWFKSPAEQRKEEAAVVDDLGSLLKSLNAD